MDNIADKIIQGDKKAKKTSRDEFGLPLDGAGTLDYLVARIFLRNPGIYLDPEDNQLYIGQRRIEESQRMAVELSDHYNKWCKGGRWPMIFNRVKKFAPRLDRSKLYIADNLLWDIDNHKLIVTKEKVKGV